MLGWDDPRPLSLVITPDRARSLAPFPLVFALLTAGGYLGILLAPLAAPGAGAALGGLGGL